MLMWVLIKISCKVFYQNCYSKKIEEFWNIHTMKLNGISRCSCKITLGLFAYSLKTSENLSFSDVFRGIERGHFQPSFSHFSLLSWKLYIFGRIALFKKYHEALIPNCYEDVLQAFNIFKNICCLMKRLTLKFWLSTEFKRNNRSLFLS